MVTTEVGGEQTVKDVRRHAGVGDVGEEHRDNGLVRGGQVGVEDGLQIWGLLQSRHDIGNSTAPN